MTPELFAETKECISQYLALMSEEQKRELQREIRADTNYLSVTVCKFKLLDDSPWQTGFIINEDGWIIDSKGKPVEEIVWSYALCPSYGSLCIPTNLLTP
jgi:hypothetical protein